MEENMKNIKYAVYVLLALALLFSPMHSVQAAGPSGSWRSGIACQNMDANVEANVVLTFYPELNSVSAATYSSSIPAGGSKNWLTTSSVSMPGFPSNFVGSAVVTSNTPLACNVNTETTGTGTTTNPYRMGTSYGLDENTSGTVIYIPQAAKNFSGFNSYISIQNTSGSTVTANLNFYAANGSEIAAAAQSVNIPALASKVFYQNENTGLPDGFNGGARVSAGDGSTRLAVVVAIYRDATNYTRTQFYSYNGVPSGAPKVFVPRFVRNLQGYQSGMAIQNVGSTDTIVTVRFLFLGVEYVYTSPAIPPNTSHLLYAPNIAVLSPVDLLPEGQRQGSATITVDDLVNDEIVVTVNSDNQAGIATRRGQGATYNAPADGSQTQTIFFPQFTKNAGVVFSSGFQVSNTTNQDGTCTIEYIAQPSANETNVLLPADGSIIRWGPQITALTNGYNAAVKVTCTRAVTGIVNFAAYGRYGDSFTETTGLNR
jgi:hypothetical protein